MAGLLKGPDATEPGGEGAEIEKANDPGGVERHGGQNRAGEPEGEMEVCPLESRNENRNPG